MAPTQDEDKQWHLDRKVPVSIIAVVVSQFLGGMWVIADIKKDIEVLKASFVVQHERDDRQDKASNEAVNLVRQDIKEVSQKLDRLIERPRK